MSFSMNIHLHGTGNNVEAELNGPGEGQCVNLYFNDYNYKFSFHYGEEQDKAEFISKLKKAINALPDFGQEKEKEE